MLKRIHRPRVWYQHSNFGPGVFSNFDAQLTLEDTPDGGGVRVFLFDPGVADTDGSVFEETNGTDQQVNGVLWPNGQTNLQFESLRLYNSLGGLVTTQAAAATAVARRPDGAQWEFDIIHPRSASAGESAGRLTRMLDRNGNPVTIQYQFARNASDAQLGYDRDRLWVMSSVVDPHGLTLTFSYVLQGSWDSWVISQALLPNGQSVFYHYGSEDILPLNRIDHPDGSVSTFIQGEDDVTQEHAVAYDDPAAGGTHRKKTVYFTRDQYVDPETQETTLQVSYLVRRVFNGAGELTYYNDPDVADPTTIYAFAANYGFARVRYQAPDRLITDFATTWVIGQDPRTFTYEPRADLELTDFLKVGANTDGLGHQRLFEYTGLTGKPTKVTYPDASTELTTYNSFAQPLSITDRLGRKTQYTYDAKGNLLTEMRGVGTPEASAWKYQYNSRGQVTRAFDPNYLSSQPTLHVTDYAYNPSGYLVSKTKPADAVGGVRATSSYLHDSSGRLTQTTGPSGQVVQFSYDSRNRLVTTIYADSSTETLTYGSGADANLLVQATDRNGNIARYDFDSVGRSISETKAFGKPEAVTRQCSFLTGTDLPSTCTDRGNREDYSYDHRRRPIGTTSHPNTAIALTTQAPLNRNGFPLYTQDPYGRRTYFVYDVNDRVTRRVAELVPGALDPAANFVNLARITTPNPSFVIEDTVFDPAGQLSEQRDGRNTPTRFEYDSQGRKAAVIAAPGSTIQARTEYQFDRAGNCTREIHPREFTEGGTFETAFTYTGRNLVASVTEGFGTPLAATKYSTYTLSRKLQSETDFRGNATTFAYTACCDRLTSRTDPSGAVTSYTHDPFGNIVTTADPNGNVTRRTFDARNRVVTSTNGANEATTFTYDDDLTDGVGIDAQASRTSGLSLGVGAAGSAVQTTDPLGHTTLDLTDGKGRTVRQLDGNNNASTVKLDVMVSGLLEISVTDPLGHTTRTRTDGAGSVRTAVDALNYISTRTFDAVGNQLQARDPNSTGTTCQFDTRNRKTSCTDTQGDTNAWAYDAESNTVTLTDGSGHNTTYTFDVRNRKLTERDRLGGVISFGYDGDNRIVSMTDAENSVTSYLFDGRGLLTRETLPAQQAGVPNVRNYGYDPGRRMISRTDQTGVVSTFVYDAANRLKERRYPDSQNDVYAYDSTSRLTSATNGRYGTTVTRTYDNGNRLLSEKQRIGSTNYGVSYGYDAANRNTRITYPDGSVINRGYTNRDQLSSVKVGTTLVASRTYDFGLRLTRTTFGNALNEDRTYRADNEVTSISTPGISVLGYQYDANKRATQETNALLPAEALTYGYDVEDRLVDWKRGPVSTPAQTQSWNLSLVGDWQTTTRDGALETRTHNPVHEIVNLTKQGQPTVDLSHDAKGNLNGTEAGQGLTWDFENRLAAAGAPPGSAPAAIKINFQPAAAQVPSGYLVDAGQLYGNRANGQTYGWSLDRTPDTRERNVNPDQRYDTLVHMKRLNQVPVANWDLALPNGQYTVRLVMGDPSFQDQTNHIKIEGVTYTDPDPYDDDQDVDAFGDFDEVTRTVTITDGKLTLSPSSGCYNTKLVFIEVTPLSGGGGTAAPGLAAATYKYDALGRRLQKSTGGVTTTFVHDGDQVVAEYEGTTLKRRYIYGAYIDEPLAMVTSAGTQYYHQSRIYSVMALSNQSGQLAERYGYTPYGKRRVVSPGGATLASSAVGNQVGFTGRYHDAETGLTYFRARYMDAELGRFVGRDPIRFADLASLPRLGASGPPATRAGKGSVFAYSRRRNSVLDLAISSPNARSARWDQVPLEKQLNGDIPTYGLHSPDYGLNLYSAHFVPNTQDPSGLCSAWDYGLACGGAVLATAGAVIGILTAPATLGTGTYVTCAAALVGDAACIAAKNNYNECMFKEEQGDAYCRGAYNWTTRGDGTLILTCL